MKTIHVPCQDAFSAMVTEDLIALATHKEGLLYIALPGGRSAASVIKAVLNTGPIARRIYLYLVDERLEGERNETTLREAGLQKAFDEGWMEESQLIIPTPGKTLSEQSFDRVYLGIGEDGHFASLFPGTFTTEAQDQVILITDSPKDPPRRATLSFGGFATLASKAKVFLLFFGESKRDPLKRMLHTSDGPLLLPAAYFKELGFDCTVITDLEERL
jgi:6-phosphogluconolactonase